MPEVLHNCNVCNGSDIQTLDVQCHICKCASCGYVFDSPRPTAAEIVDYYSKPVKYDGWLAREQEREQLWKRRLKKVLRHSKQGSLLDIGAGIGQFLALARDSFTAVCGTEVSQSAVGIARQKYGLELLHSQVEDVDFKGITFDNITLFHVLEHVPTPALVVEKCRALLDSGGILFVAVPNELLSFRNKVRRMLHRAGLKSIKYHGAYGLPKIALDGSVDEIHLSHFTPDVLQHLLEKNGFTVIERNIDPYFAEKGLSLLINKSYYALMWLVCAVFRVNAYNTIWIVAKRN